MVPLILTGGLYYPGYTHLPGVALTLLVLASAVSQRFAVAGVLLAIFAFMKILMLPGALLLLALVIIILRAWRAIGPVTMSFSLTTAAILTLLFIRGELGPYLESLALNLAYSQGPLVESRWV